MRGSVHSLQSAHNGFTLARTASESDDLFFGGGNEASVAVYALDSKLFFLTPNFFVLERVELSEDVICLKSGFSIAPYYSLNYERADGTFLPSVNRLAVGAWESFRLAKPPVLECSEQMLIDKIDSFTDNLNEIDFESALTNNFNTKLMADCLASSSYETDEIFLQKVDNLHFAQRLQKAFHLDLHAKAFLCLFEGIASPEREIALGGLWKTGIDGHAPGVPFAINCCARQQREPTKKVCMLTTLRNEAPYIIEWLAYHRSIGIEKFFVYENDSQDGSSELLDCLADHGLIEVTHNKVQEGGNAQNSAYTHALSIRPELLEFEWCVIIDLDEFLLLNQVKNADEYLRGFDDSIDAIAVNWVVYGPNGRLCRDPSLSVMDAYTWRVPHPDMHIKSIIRPRKFFTSSPHYPYRYRSQPYKFADLSGLPYASAAHQLAWAERPEERFASVAHYNYKSLDEFLLKWSRNRGDFPRQLDATNKNITSASLEAFVRDFDNRSSHHALKERSIIAGQEANRIRLLKGVSAIEAIVEERYARNIVAIRESFLDCPAAQQSESGPQFRDLIHLASKKAELNDLE